MTTAVITPVPKCSTSNFPDSTYHVASRMALISAVRLMDCRNSIPSAAPLSRSPRHRETLRPAASEGGCYVGPAPQATFRTAPVPRPAWSFPARQQTFEFRVHANRFPALELDRSSRRTIRAAADSARGRRGGRSRTGCAAPSGRQFRRVSPTGWRYRMYGSETPGVMPGW
jgi:hypothetical protein